MVKGATKAAVMVLAAALCVAAPAGAHVHWHAAPGHLSAANRHALVVSGSRPPFDQAAAERTMLAAAASYWQQAPACGTPVLERVDQVPADSSVQPDSWAYVLPDGPQTCVIYLVAGDWTLADERDNWAVMCRLVAHEDAHLLDKWDVDAPGTMLDHVVDGSVPDPYCDEGAPGQGVDARI